MVWRTSRPYKYGALGQEREADPVHIGIAGLPRQLYFKDAEHLCCDAVGYDGINSLSHQLGAIQVASDSNWVQTGSRLFPKLAIGSPDQVAANLRRPSNTQQASLERKATYCEQRWSLAYVTSFTGV